MPLPEPALLPFLFGFVALIALPFRPPWPIPVAASTISLLLALWQGVVDPVGFGVLAGFFSLALWLIRSPNADPRASTAGLIFLLLMSVALALHVVPGINNRLILDDVVVSSGAVPFTLYWNYDKLVVGMALLAVVVYRLPGLKPSGSGPLVSILPFVVTPAVVFVTAMLLGIVAFDPKFPDFFWWWAVSNLLITCVAEEAFFRGIVMRGFLQAWRSTRNGTLYALAASSILFGSVHFAGGAEYVILSTIAGLGYGAAYLLTGRIESSILAHFILNVCHILLFSYPMLSSAVAA